MWQFDINLNQRKNYEIQTVGMYHRFEFFSVFHFLFLGTYSFSSVIYAPKDEKRKRKIVSQRGTYCHVLSVIIAFFFENYSSIFNIVESDSRTAHVGNPGTNGSFPSEKHNNYVLIIIEINILLDTKAAERG